MPEASPIIARQTVWKPIPDLTAPLATVSGKRPALIKTSLKFQLQVVERFGGRLRTAAPFQDTPRQVGSAPCPCTGRHATIDILALRKKAP